MRLPNPHEEGATAVMSVFAIATFLLAVGLLAIDAGSIWVSRRTQVADTDAAALATAQRLTETPCAPDSATLTSVASELIVDGDISPPRVTLDQPLGVCTGAGVVTVETTRSVDLFFAPLFGLDPRETTALSAVAYGQIMAAHGVKPLAFCNLAFSEEDRTYEYAAVTSNPVYSIDMTTETSPCSGGSGAGNAGIVDFDRAPGVPGTKEINEWIEDGSKYEVDLGGSGLGDEDCNAGNDVPNEWCQGRPMKSLSPPDFGPLFCDPACPFWVVIYSEAGPDPDEKPREDKEKEKEKEKDKDGDEDEDKPAGGATLHYKVHALARVVLRTDPGDLKGNNRVVDLELIDELADGRLGAVSDSKFSSMGIQQCGVDGFTENCASVLTP